MDRDVRTAGYEAYFGAEGGSFRNFSKYLKFRIERMFCEAVIYVQMHLGKPKVLSDHTTMLKKQLKPA